MTDPTAGVPAYQALARLIAQAVELTTESHDLRMQLATADTEERMQLASEAMQKTMNAVEVLARAVDLAFNMATAGMTARVTPNEPPPERPTLTVVPDGGPA